MSAESRGIGFIEKSRRCTVGQGCCSTGKGAKCALLERSRLVPQLVAWEVLADLLLKNARLANHLIRNRPSIFYPILFKVFGNWPVPCYEGNQKTTVPYIGIKHVRGDSFTLVWSEISNFHNKL
jgi:hypothetical protein